MTWHLTKDELEGRYKKEVDPRTKERLLAILLLHDGKKVSEVSRIVRRSVRTVENWISRWNVQGYDGLIPRFDGGPKPRMASGEWDKIVREIEGKGMTIRDVAVHVKDTRGVNYSYKTVWKILRKEKKVRYGKAYKMNAKRPPDAERILKKR
jgi:putative transposase